MPVVDTTFLIALEKEPHAARPVLDALVDSREPLVVPVQVAIEYAAGTNDPAEAVRKLRASFVLVPAGPVIAVEAARMARASFAEGRFPGWSDIQVAATARTQGMAVVTRNRRHYEVLGVRTIDHT